MILKPQTVILREMLESLNQAIGGCDHLIHHLQDPRFIFIRAGLQNALDKCAEIAPQGLRFKPREKKIIVPMASTKPQKSLVI